MSTASAYVVEVVGETAGLAVAELRGFRFFAAARAAYPIDGRSFRSLAEVNAAAARLLGAGKPGHRETRGLERAAA